MQLQIYTADRKRLRLWKNYSSQKYERLNVVSIKNITGLFVVTTVYRIATGFPEVASRKVNNRTTVKIHFSYVCFPF